jgi:ankyrin repeat protein
MTPLHQACLKSDAPTVRFLLQYGAKPNIVRAVAAAAVCGGAV